MPPDPDPDCPFCHIAAAFPPFPPGSHPPPSASASAPPSPLAHILLATPSLLAFLDHAPLSRGHVLLATRTHREKLSDVSVAEGRTLGAWLGVLSRAVVGPALEGVGEGEEEVGGWNVVQNNGAGRLVAWAREWSGRGYEWVRAAQVVPHVHFHIIPRPGDVPVVESRSWTIFGKGQREDLDEEDAVGLVGRMRERLGREVEMVGEREGEAGWRALGLGEREMGRRVRGKL